jgi:polyisoprenoid-binding protein YceI
MTMHRIAYAFISALALPSAALAAPETYRFDPNHTNITWHANHLGFSNPSGKFTLAEGTLVLDEKDPAKSSVEAIVSTESLTTGLPKFDEHLKSMDFLNVEKYGKATFKSTRVEMTGKDSAKVHGQFTLLGITMPLVLDVKLNKIGENPMTKQKTVGFSATTTISRTQYGMTFGIPNVGSEVPIAIEIEATKQP